MLIRQVVIADDNINAKRLGIGDHLHGFYTTVERYEQGIIVAVCIINALLRYAIAFAVAVWDIVCQLSFILIFQERI